MTPPTRPYRALSLALLALLAACGEAPPAVDLPQMPGSDDPALRARLPLPYRLSHGPILVGGQQDKFSDASAHLRGHLSSSYEITDDYRMFYAALDSSVTWADIDAFYTDAFTRPPLAGAGFVRRDVALKNPGWYTFALWSRPGRRVGLRAPADEVLVVLFVPPRPGGWMGAIGRMRRLDARLDGELAR